MPIYEYKCGDCGYVFEEYRALKEADQKAKCPKCEKTGAERVPSVFASCGGEGKAAAGSCGTSGGKSFR